MKHYNIVKLIPVLAAVVSLTGCLKGDKENLPAQSGSILELFYVEGGNGTTINSGLQYFGSTALTYPASDASDTAYFNISVEGTDPASKDMTFTIGADAGSLLDNYSADSIKYEMMPDSTFSLLTTTATVAKGKRASTMIGVVFHPNKFDITKSYMLPITITDAQGVPVSANYGKIYFHVIGNPYAGNYTDTYTRWQSDDTTTAYYSKGNLAATWTPDNPTTIEVESGYAQTVGLTYRYQITFGTDGKLQSVVINPTDVKNTLAGSSISLAVPAKVIFADEANKHFKFTYGVVNGSGAPRTFTDEFIINK